MFEKGTPKRAVYQLKSSKIQERSEVDWEMVTDRGKETWEWLGLFRWFIPQWPHDMHLGRPSIFSGAGIASVLHRELNLTRQESQETIVEPPGADSHAVVCGEGGLKCSPNTRFPFIGTGKNDYLTEG